MSFYHTMFFADLIFYIWFNSNVLIHVYYYYLYLLYIFCEKCFHITLRAIFLLHLFIMFLLRRIFHFNELILYKQTQIEKSPRSHLCNNNVLRACYAKYLRNKKQLKNGRQKGLIIPEWLLKEKQTPMRKKVLKKLQNIKTGS